MKEKITTFLDGLIKYDYILFGSTFTLFILLIILALVLRKRIGLAIFLVLLSFSTLLIAPTLGYIKMHEYLFKNSLTVISEKKLEFMDAIVLKGSLTNESNIDFKSCKITAKIHKSSKNSLKDYIYKFKSIKKMTIIKENIVKESTITFKMIIEPFTYSKKYNISLGAKCK